MQLSYDCFVGASAQRGRGRTRTTSLHRVAKACCHPEPRVPLGKLRRSVDSSDQAFARASCHEEAKRSDLSRWLTEASCKQAAPETNLYFYHPDHIGSSSFITDATGYAVQHLQYLPFDETFVDQQNGYDSRYTFSAKEKDDETQYSYFGARYYDSDLSVWLSVDPLSDKYPSMSAYMYCAGNPVILVDPDGRKIKGFSIDKNGNVEIGKHASKDAVTIYNAMSKTNTGKDAFIEMVEVETKINLKLTKRVLRDSKGEQLHGRTDGKGNKDGVYRRAKITISTAENKTLTSDRFNGFSDEEKINAIGTHEKRHTDADQILRDKDYQMGKIDLYTMEKDPVLLEFKSRMEYREKFGKVRDRNIIQNYEKFLEKSGGTL